MAKGKQGHAPVKHIAPKILIAANYCGSKLPRRLGSVTPAYHKKVYSQILEEASVGSSMTAGLIDALGCGLGCGM